MGQKGISQQQLLNTQAAITQNQQQQAETQRENNLTAGKNSIDAAYQPFNDDYFNKYQQANIDAATPQINDQYNVAKDKLFADLVGRGVQNSTVAGGAYGNLDKTKAIAEGDAANSAADATTAFRSQVQNQKNQLYALNAAGGDPSQIATQAIGSATALVPPQTTSPIGDLFSGVLSPFATYASSATYSPYSNNVFNNGTVLARPNSRVVA